MPPSPSTTNIDNNANNLTNNLDIRILPSPGQDSLICGFPGITPVNVEGVFSIRNTSNIPIKVWDISLTLSGSTYGSSGFLNTNLSLIHGRRTLLDSLSTVIVPPLQCLDFPFTFALAVGYGSVLPPTIDINSTALQQQSMGSANSSHRGQANAILHSQHLVGSRDTSMTCVTTYGLQAVFQSDMGLALSDTRSLLCDTTMVFPRFDTNELTPFLTKERKSIVSTMLKDGLDCTVKVPISIVPGDEFTVTFISGVAGTGNNATGTVGFFGKLGGAAIEIREIVKLTGNELGRKEWSHTVFAWDSAHEPAGLAESTDVST
jgi:hypothetical protein